jgi:hypothetical protein
MLLAAEQSAFANCSAGSANRLPPPTRVTIRHATVETSDLSDMIPPGVDKKGEVIPVVELLKRTRTNSWPGAARLAMETILFTIELVKLSQAALELPACAMAEPATTREPT